MPKLMVNHFILLLPPRRRKVVTKILLQKTTFSIHTILIISVLASINVSAKFIMSATSAHQIHIVSKVPYATNVQPIAPPRREKMDKNQSIHVLDVTQAKVYKMMLLRM